MRQGIVGLRRCNHAVREITGTEMTKTPIVSVGVFYYRFFLFFMC